MNDQETQNLNQTTESIPSFLQEGMEETKTTKSPKKYPDPEDVFNQGSSESDEEKGAVNEEDDPMGQNGPNYAYHRKLYTLNVTEKVTHGNFLPVTMLVEEGFIDPLTQIVDPNSGAMIAHYAAHHGHLKFLRYLKKYFQQKLGSAKGFPDFKDNYDCNLAHYAVRQGHLPILIYLIDGLHIDCNQRDKFGYSPLEYAVVYKKLNCFIYLLYNRGYRAFKPELVESVAVSLFSENPGNDFNKVIGSDGETTTSFKIIQILLREPDLSKIFAPIFLINAIKNQRLDVLEEVAHRAYYFPKRAEKDKSTMDIPQSITDEQMSAVITSLPSISNVGSAETVSEMRAILKGQKCQIHDEIQKSSRCCYQFSRSIKIFVAQVVGMLGFYFLVCQVSQFPVPKDWSAIESLSFMLKFPFVAFFGQDCLSKNLCNGISSVSQLREYKEELMLDGQIENLDVRLGFESNSIMFSMMALVTMMFWAILNQFIFLFTNNGMESIVHDKPYILGDAPRIFASYMTIIDPRNGQTDMGYLDLISTYYEEICFKNFIFKCHMYDWDPKLDNYVRENHGFSTFYLKNINRTNFRFQVLNKMFLNLFFLAATLHVMYFQNIVKFHGSNMFIKLFELHIIALTGALDSKDNARFAFALFLSEALFVHTQHRLMIDLYCIGRQITRLELKSPWLYVQTRFGTVFKRAQPTFTTKPMDEIDMQCFGISQKQHQHQHIDFNHSNAFIGMNVWNVCVFLTGYQWSARDPEPQSMRIGFKEGPLSTQTRGQQVQKFTVYGGKKKDEIEMQAVSTLDETLDEDSTTEL